MSKKQTDMQRLLVNKVDHEDFKEIANNKGLKMYALFEIMLNEYIYQNRLPHRRDR
jgi:hypothetical protein